MADTQKTTKGVREAPTASKEPCSTVHAGHLWIEGTRGWQCQRCNQTKVIRKPRYTVELTTEGWQMKDNVRGVILADIFRSKSQALETIDAMNLGSDSD